MNCRPIIGLFGFLVGDVSLVVRFEIQRGDALIEVLIHMVHDDTHRGPQNPLKQPVESMRRPMKPWPPGYTNH